MKMKSALERIVILAVFAAFIISLSTCKKKDDNGPNPPTIQNDTLVSSTANIGASGGQLVLPDGSKLTIPANALSNDVTITISKIKGNPIIGLADVEYIKLEPEGLVYNSAVSLELPLSNIQKIDTSLLVAATMKDGVIENLEPVIDKQKNVARISITHHSWLSLNVYQKLYLVLDIPGKYLMKGDLIYALALTTGNDKFWWFPGHAALYLGTSDPISNNNDGESIIESTPDFDGVSMNNTFSTFKSSWFHLFMGARRYNGGITAQNRNEIASYSISKLGTCYAIVGGRFFKCYSCVNLTELSYEHTGLNIIPLVYEFPTMLPYTQYALTNPVNEIVVKAGESMSIPIYGVVWKGFSEGYKNDASDFTAQVSNLPSGATFSNNKFEWQPNTSYIGQNISVSFSVIAKSDDLTYKLYETLKIHVIQGSTITKPTITTNEITNKTETSATGGGEVNSDGGAAVTARGVCWSTLQNPTISDNHTSDGTGTGNFISDITNLTPNTIYHVRAYATNSAGTGYGDDVTFTTVICQQSIDQLQEGTDYGFWFDSSIERWQEFKPAFSRLNAIDVSLYINGLQGDLIAKITDQNGSIVATKTINEQNVPIGIGWVTITFSSPVVLTLGNIYRIVITGSKLA
ncbi:MAG: fibronectin type III domain-containing protein, partial [Bacteroidetes bacterium]|nr:fibronectin type III domain-containing protein [Bacteroidota bacterium]